MVDLEQTRLMSADAPHGTDVIDDTEGGDPFAALPEGFQGGT